MEGKVFTFPSDMPESARPLWAGALFAAVKDKNMVAAFTRDTGVVYNPPKSGFDRMIDEATGVDAKIAKAFCDWFNEKVWGPWDG
jgi:hypothetical protein